MSAKKLTADLNKLALLAGVPVPARQQFIQEVQSAIEGAHRFAGMNWSKPATRDISKLLKEIAADAQNVVEKIQAIRKQAGKWNKEDFARTAFVVAFPDEKLSINDALAATKIIAESAADAAKQVIRLGRPSGTRKRPAFDAFATRLYFAVHQAGGNLNIYKSSAGEWSGRFLVAFSILESHLPKKNFSPAGEMGRVLHRISKQMRRHFTP